MKTGTFNVAKGKSGSQYAAYPYAFTNICCAFGVCISGVAGTYTGVSVGDLTGCYGYGYVSSEASGSKTLQFNLMGVGF